MMAQTEYRKEIGIILINNGIFIAILSYLFKNDIFKLFS